MRQAAARQGGCDIGRFDAWLRVRGRVVVRVCWRHQRPGSVQRHEGTLAMSWGAPTDYRVNWEWQRGFDMHFGPI